VKHGSPPPWLLVPFYVACSNAGTSSTVEIRREAASAPSDTGASCSDVAELRVCWGGARCGPLGCLVPRPLPASPAPDSGFRCAGQRQARHCEARTDRASAFACTNERCVQHRPRTPDAGEWNCVDSAGAVYCRHVVDAAGIPNGPRDPGYVCGARRGTGEEICVDLSPDTPPGKGPWACSTRYTAGVAERHCVCADAPRLGMTCQGAHSCPSGAACVQGHCLPGAPVGNCWLDGDCGEALCRFGTCTEKAR
jgi:hypothetical protein